MSKYLKSRFGASKQVRYCAENPILPLGYVKNKPPMYKPRLVNSYTPEGRALIHKELPAGLLDTLNVLMHNPILTRSVEYNDNRLSLFAGQLGKCALTGTTLEIGECAAHHIIPVNMGGDDSYGNLLFVTTPVHRLLHATREETIARYLDALNLSKEQLERLDRYRGLMNLDPVTS